MKNRCIKKKKKKKEKKKKKGVFFFFQFGGGGGGGGELALGRGREEAESVLQIHPKTPNKYKKKLFPVSV